MMKDRTLFDEFDDPIRLWGVDEIFENADESLLGQLKENRRIERKPASFGPQQLGDYICMWANTSPEGGLIALGVLNDGTFEGCLKLSTDQINDREKAGHVYCPDASVETKHVRVTNTKGLPDFVVLIRVRYNRRLVVKTVSGKAFVRKGESKCELKPEEVRELQADKGEVSFEDQHCGLIYPDDFRMSEVAAYVSKVRKARNIPDTLSVTEVLTLRRLGGETESGFVPTMAMALLFAKDPNREIPGCKVRFQRFDGEKEGTGDKYNAVKDEIFEGTIAELVSQTESALDSQLRTFAPLDARGKFFPVPEYPRKAWYEALINALVHRSYGNGLKTMPVFVKMFDDRLVIESPGPFPPFVTPENIYDMHIPRNPNLMDVLFYLEVVRCSHEGTRRIRDLMAESKLPAPEFRQADEGHPVVRVILRNDVKQRRAWIDRDVSRLVSEAIAAELSEDEKRVLNFAAVHKRVTISDVQKLLDTHWQDAKRVLFDLAGVKRILQYIRFKPFEKDHRDTQAYFRLRSKEPLPEGAFEQTEMK